MKKILLSVLAALAGLGSARAADTATLYASNLGSGLTAQGGTTAVSTGTIRFGTFPAGFDFAGNADDFAAMDAAFKQVHSVSGPISALSTAGFFDIEHDFATNVSYEGTAYDGSAASTTDVAGDIAGEKIFIWVLNNTTASAATQQAVFSSNQTWPDKDLLVTDVTVSADVGTPGLVAHLGVQSGGSDIGAGAASHTMGGATEIPSQVVASRTPSAATLVVGTSVTFSYQAQGTAPFTQEWFKTGNTTPLGTGSTLTLSSAQLADDGSYYVVVTNGAGDETSNSVELDIVTAIPAFEDQPDPLAVKAGGNATFTVLAKGAGTLSYRWLKGTAPVPGGTQATLNLYGVSLTDAGLYRCEVSNVVAGKTNKVLSAQALLTVVQDNIPAAIVVARAGATASTTLTLNYSETGVLAASKATLQWYKDGAIITGATGKTLKISPLVTAATAPLYTCEVQAAGVSGTVTGASTRLFVVNEAPVISDASGLNMPDGVVGKSYSYQVPYDQTSAAKAPTFAATGLPTGLTINPFTGLISGRPLAVTKTGGALVKITVTNGTKPDDTAQDTIVIAALPTNLAGSWVGPIDRDTLSEDLGGRLEMTIAATGAVSGKIFLGTAVHSLAGGIEPNTVDGSATATLTIKRLITQRPLTVSFTLSGNVLSLGTITDGVSTPLSFEGWRNKWLASPVASTAADYTARYHMLLELNDPLQIGDLDIPQGKSFASFTVAKDGKFTFVGKLSDDEGITGGTFIGPAGQVFMYQTLYKTVQKGSLLGRLTIDTKANTNPSDNTLTGDADWSRPANFVSNKLYAAGFDPAALSIAGGAYVAPVSTTATPRVLLNIAPGTGNAKLSVTDANLEDPEDTEDDILESVSIAAASKITVGNTNELNILMTGVPTTGVLSGTLKPGAKAEKIQGLVVPVDGEQIGVGFFLIDDTALSSRLSGAVILENSIE